MEPVKRSVLPVMLGETGMAAKKTLKYFRNFGKPTLFNLL